MLKHFGGKLILFKKFFGQRKQTGFAVWFLAHRGNQIGWYGKETQTEFSMRSAYHLAKEKMQHHQGESSMANQTRGVWKKIWNLNVPGAVKTFLWRVCHNSLPTWANLHKREITIDPLCPLCGMYLETIGHVLWSCATATAVWIECKRKIQKLSIWETYGLLLFEQWKDHLEDEDLELVVFLARRLWLRRNIESLVGLYPPPL